MAYKPLAHDVWTIGWGHTRTAKEGQRITQEEADNLFRSDVASFEKPLRQLLRGRVELTQYQWDALVSLVYNIGIGAFRKSKAYKSLCAKDEKAFVHQAFNPETGFVHSGGQKVRGLIRRRAREKDLFLGKPA